MTLGPGARLGPYEISSLLGAGGMGEVYRARDTRLDRVVAIKVLASVLASEPQVRERFEREARAISALNHPNICVLHDVGREVPLPPAGSRDTQARDAAPLDYLVMEYLEGETLAARLARGAMSVDEALRIAIPIARALDRAHRQGIVHRDLKPANVMLTKAEGAEAGVKLLDFGLARLTKSMTAGAGGAANESQGRGLVSLADLATPTMSTPLTMKGSIVGTLQYMAPEQIEGKEIDARTDIFAFGAMLYEMLTGRRPFAGKSQASLIGAILDHDPPTVSSVQPATPSLLEEIVRRALAKDPDDRWQSARDVMRQLEWVASQPSRPSSSTAGTAAASASVGSRIAGMSIPLIAGAVLATAVVPWLLWPQPPAPAPVTRSAYVLPDDQTFTRPGRHVMALSPDGTRLVYVANQQLYLRQLNELGAAPIVGTEKSDPTEPVFSPDGSWVAFWSSNQLRKVPVTGGTPVTLCAAQNPFGMTWVGDRILFGQNDQQGNRGIVEVSHNGGTPNLLIAVDAEKGASVHGPQVVDGGRAVVFAERPGTGRWDDGNVVVRELATGTQTVLVERGTDPHVLSTGHLVFARDAALFAVPFDVRTLSVTGGPVPVQEGVLMAAGNASGAVHAAFSPHGTLAFIPGLDTSTERTLVWVDRNGKVERAAAPTRNYSTRAYDHRISPDGTRVAVVINADRQLATVSAATRGGQAIAGDDVWVLDTSRTTLTRLTFTTAAGFPIWTPDGRRVCYVHEVSMFCQPADGSGQPQVVGNVEGPEFTVNVRSSAVGLRAFSPDGKRMLFAAQGAKTKSFDIFMTTAEPSPETRALIQTPFSETGAAVSPDGRWLAYHSNESGRNEVYVRPFPDVGGGRWQISTESGAEPRWAANGRELFFTAGGGPIPLVLWSASIQPGSSFVAGPAKVVMKFPDRAGAAHDVAPDGRFLFNVPTPSQSTSAETKPQIVLVQNWFHELRSRVPTGTKN